MEKRNIKVCTGAGNTVMLLQPKLDIMTKIIINWIAVIFLRVWRSQSASVTSDQGTVHKREFSANLATAMTARSRQHELGICTNTMHIFRMPQCAHASMQSMWQCVWTVKAAQSRKEENRFDWLILVCDAALVPIASAMTPSEHGSESLIGCERVPWYHISHQGLLNRVFGRNWFPQSGQ